jgi:hypothetical protein
MQQLIEITATLLSRQQIMFMKMHVSLHTDHQVFKQNTIIVSLPLCTITTEEPVSDMIVVTASGISLNVASNVSPEVI